MGEGTFAGTRGNDENAPIPGLPALASERGGLTYCRPSSVLINNVGPCLDTKICPGSTEVEAAVPAAPFQCRNARAPNICSDDGPRAIIGGDFTTRYLEQDRLIGSKLHKIEMLSKSTGQKSSLIRTVLGPPPREDPAAAASADERKTQELS
jgi:hypothetical protein